MVKLGSSYGALAALLWAVAAFWALPARGVQIGEARAADALREGVFTSARPSTMRETLEMTDVIANAITVGKGAYAVHTLQLLLSASATASDPQLRDGYINATLFLRGFRRNPPGCLDSTAPLTTCHYYWVSFSSPADGTLVEYKFSPGIATSMSEYDSFCFTSTTGDYLPIGDFAVPLPTASRDEGMVKINIWAPAYLTQHFLDAGGATTGCPDTAFALGLETMSGVTMLRMGATRVGGVDLVQPLALLDADEATSRNDATARVSNVVADTDLASANVTDFVLPWAHIGAPPRFTATEAPNALDAFAAQRPNIELIAYQYRYGYALKRAVVGSAASATASATSPQGASWEAMIQAGFAPVGFACVLDAGAVNASTVTQCSIPIPPGTTGMRVKLLAEEGLQRGWKSQVALELRSATATRAVACSAGPAPLRRCGAVIDCAATSITVDRSNASRVVVSLPGLRVPFLPRLASSGDSTSCGFETGVIVLFDNEAPTAAPCAWPEGVACAADATCLEPSAACDGVWHCSDGSDEALCSSWKAVSKEAQLTSCTPDRAVTTGVRQASDCAGVASASNAPATFGAVRFTNVSGPACELYSSSCVSNAIDQAAAGSSYVGTDTTAAQSALLVRQSTVDLRRVFCTSELTCSGRGVAMLQSSLGGSPAVACRCACFTNYVGAHCETLVGSSNQREFEVRVSGSASSTAIVTAIADVRAATYEPRLEVRSVARLSSSTLLLRFRGAQHASFYTRRPVTNGSMSTYAPLAPAASAADPTVALPQHCRQTTALRGECAYDVQLSTSIYAGSSAIAIVEVIAPHQLDEISLQYYDALGTALQAQAERCDEANRGAEYIEGTCTRRFCSFTMPLNAVRLVVGHVLRTANCVLGSPHEADSGDLSRPFVTLLPTVQRPTADAAVAGAARVGLEIERGSTTSSLIAMSSLFGLVGICIALMILYAVKDIMLISSLRSFESRGTFHALRGTVTTPLGAWALRILPRLQRYGTKPFSRHYDRVAVYCSLVGLIALIGAIIAGGFYAFPILAPRSNYRAVLTFYDGQACEADAISPSPTGYRSVEASGDCLISKSISTTNSSFPLVAAATCERTGSGRWDVVLYAGRTASCKVDTQDILVTGRCVPLSSLQLRKFYGKAANLQYVRAECLPSGDASDLELSLDGSLAASTTRRPPVADHVPIVASSNTAFNESYDGHPAALLQQGRSVPGLTAGSSMYGFGAFVASDGEVQRFTSNFPWRVITQSLDSVAAFGRSAFDYPAAQIVSQQADSWTLDGSAPSQTLAWEDEVRIADSARSLPKSSSRELCVGTLFNDPMNTLRTEPTLRSRSAMRDTLVFPRVAGTGFDLGQFEFPAVGFFLRATRNTSGFVFALGDDVRSSGDADDALRLPVLEKLFDVVENGYDEAWWQDAGVDVSLAIYINGALGTLSVFSVPASGDIMKATFDIDTLGRGRMFANTWHMVTIKFLEGLIELGIDGETQRINTQWTACALRPLIAVRRASATTAARMRFDTNATLYPDGALYVGALNAGLYGLQFYSDTPYKFQLGAHATTFMLGFLSHSTQAYTYMGFYLLFTAGVLLFTMLSGVITDYLSESEKAREANMTRARDLYFDIFDIDDDRNVIVIGDDEYTSLNLRSALDVTRLDPETFALVLQEMQTLAFSEEDARADLMAFLWTQAKRTFETPVRLQAIFDTWKDVESGELSEDAQFKLPEELWEQLVRQHDGETVRRRELRGKGDERDDEAQATAGGMQQLRGLKAVRGAKAGGKGSTGGGGSASGNLVQMLLPVTMALQTIGVYAQNWRLPTQYLSWVGELLDFLLFDFIRLLPFLDTVTASGVLFGIALLIQATLVYYAICDHRLWLSIAANYIIKRDAADREEVLELALKNEKARRANPDAGNVGHVRDPASGACKPMVAGDVSIRRTLSIRRRASTIDGQSPHAHSPSARGGAGGALSPRSITTPAGRRASRAVANGSFDSDSMGMSRSSRPDASTNENVLATQERVADDVIEDWMLPLFRYVVPPRVCVAIDQHVDGARSSNLINIEPDDLLPAETGGAIEWVFEPEEGSKHVKVGVSGDPEQRRIELLHVGMKCPHHTDRWLSLNLQTAVSEHIFSCFVVQSGKRCDTVHGKMYVCDYRYRDGTRCPYAICSAHAKMSLGEFMIIMIVTGFRVLKEMGVHGILAFAIISLVNVVYFPVMNACLQFLTCDARFQCAFPTCWEQPDSRFLLALIVVIIVVVFIGVGAPLTQFLVLISRYRVLYKLFYRKEYHRHYLAVDQDTIDYGRALLKQQEEDNEIDDDEEDAVFRVVRHFAPTVTTSLARRTMHIVQTSIPRLAQVSFEEWERFLAVDMSNMFPLYYMLEFEWMMLPPIILLHKIALLMPTLLLEDESLNQFIATAAVEAVFGIFIFWTQPYLNPWVDTIFRAGSVHNIGLLGFISYSRALSSTGDEDDLQYVMIAWTGAYLLFVIALLIATVLVPVLGIIVQQVDVSTQMERVGMRTIDLSSLFLNPLLHDSPELTEDEAARATGIHDDSSDSDNEEEKRHERQAALARDQDQNASAAREITRADARKAKKEREEELERRRVTAVEKTRVMALEDV